MKEKKAKKLVKAFEDAVWGLAWKGSKEPESFEEIDQAYDKAKKALLGALLEDGKITNGEGAPMYACGYLSSVDGEEQLATVAGPWPMVHQARDYIPETGWASRAILVRLNGSGYEVLFNWSVQQGKWIKAG